jgi:DNA-binding transcriptional LysR family regulator
MGAGSILVGLKRMPDLNSLVIFARVAEENGFSKAARRLGIPTSTVSRRVADLEDQLGLRLLHRSTRCLRLTGAGLEVLQHAQRMAEISETVDSIASNHLSRVAGDLRLAAPPGISDSLLPQIVVAFQSAYPDVHIHVLITERTIDQIAEGVDIAFRVGEADDSSLVARRIFAYRHALVASPAYLEKHNPPQTPQDLLEHRLVALSLSRPQRTWDFIHVNGRDAQSITFKPCLAINDSSGLAATLVAGVGIGEISLIAQTDLLRSGPLVEVMPSWRFPVRQLSMCHLGNHLIPRPVRVFVDFAARMVMKLFPKLAA